MSVHDRAMPPATQNRNATRNATRNAKPQYHPQRHPAMPPATPPAMPPATPPRYATPPCHPLATQPYPPTIALLPSAASPTPSLIPFSHIPRPLSPPIPSNPITQAEPPRLCRRRSARRGERTLGARHSSRRVAARGLGAAS